MLPYDGITRTGSKGLSHSVTETPSEVERYWKDQCMASWNCRAISRHPVRLIAYNAPDMFKEINMSEQFYN